MSRGLRYATLEDMPEGMRRLHARRDLAESRKRKPAQPAAKPRQARRAAADRDEVYEDWRNAGAIKRRQPRRDEEHEQQVVFFNRLAALAVNAPRYALAVRRTHAIPNGGGRTKREAGRLKAEGVKKGVPDIFTAVPVNGAHGLYIEMKSTGGRVSEEQAAWIADALELGYAAVVCRSATEAMAAWLAYMGAQDNGREP